MVVFIDVGAAANVPLVEDCSATLSLSIFVVFFLCLS